MTDCFSCILETGQYFCPKCKENAEFMKQLFKESGSGTHSRGEA
jgi:hypothetical protein